MVRWLAKIVGLCAFIVLGSYGIWFYQDHYSSQRQIERLEEKNRVLTRVVERLSDEKRVAQVLVTEQKIVDGVRHSTLLFVEDDKLGQSLPPRSFNVQGDFVHFDALVIKFDRDFVKDGDPLRGHSIALFTRVFGDHQLPANAEVIDHPGQIPDIYRGADPRVSQFELELWNQFWRLTDDKAYREQYGVRVANGQGIWGPFEPDKLYTITLESDGGLNLQTEPLKSIYKEALKNRAATQPANPVQ